MTPTRGTVVEHLAHMRLRGLSPNTIRTRAYCLARVQAVVPVPLHAATRTDLTAWQRTRTDQIRPTAVRAEITHVRSYFRWLCEEEIRADDPSRALHMPRAPRRIPNPMPEDDVAFALTAATGDPEMRAIIALGACAGLRCCGIASLDWSEVNLGRDPHLTVIEKGGHQRRIPIDGEAVEALRALPRRRTGPVIPRRDGKPGHNAPHAISHRGNRFLHRIGIPQTMHSLRHRAASVGYEETGDPMAGRDYLGHADMQTFSGYTKLSDRRIKAFAAAVGRVGRAS